MLILCSNGLSSENIINELRSNMSDCKSAALVVTADNEYKENNYHVDRCIRELVSLGLSVDILDIDKLPPEKLLDFDVVEFIGGNPYYLINSIRSHNAEDILKVIATSRILIGWSAAAFVFGPSLELVNKYSPDMNFLGVKDLKGLNLTNVEVLPHYSKFISRFDKFEETCDSYEKENSIQVIRLNDGDAVIIRNDEVKVIHR